MKPLLSILMLAAVSSACAVTLQVSASWLQADRNVLSDRHCRSQPLVGHPLLVESGQLLRCATQTDEPAQLTVLAEQNRILAVEWLGVETQQIPESWGTSLSYLGVQVYPQQGVVFDDDGGRLWLADRRFLHSHAFLNALHNYQEPLSSQEQTDDLNWLLAGINGESIAEPAAQLCQTLEAKPVDVSRWNAPYEGLLQQNCIAPVILGNRRKVELMLRDQDRLAYAWVLLSEEELGRVRHKLEKRFGAAQSPSSSYLGFGESGIYLRLDKPELLIAEPVAANWLIPSN